jgi:hypothetical protein
MIYISKKRKCEICDTKEAKRSKELILGTETNVTGFTGWKDSGRLEKDQKHKRKGLSEDYGVP